MENYAYDRDSLKIQPTETTKLKAEENTATIDVTRKQEEILSNRKATLVIVMLIAMYAIVSALPTFLIMHFGHLSFWLTQAIVFIVVVIVVWAFGLYKPASNEQKLKSKYLL